MLSWTHWPASDLRSSGSSGCRSALSGCSSAETASSWWSTELAGKNSAFSFSLGIFSTFLSGHREAKICNVHLADKSNQADDEIEGEVDGGVVGVQHHGTPALHTSLVNITGKLLEGGGDMSCIISCGKISI